MTGQERIENAQSDGHTPVWLLQHNCTVHLAVMANEACLTVASMQMLADEHAAICHAGHTLCTDAIV